MTTCNILLPAYIAEYVKGLYNNGSNDPVTIPDDTDLYHVIWNLMSRRPANVSPISVGNLTLNLPDCRAGKNPIYFNYLSQQSQQIIAIHIKRMFDAELHDLMTANAVSKNPLRHIDIAHQFMCAYCLESITEDALIKNYYRWRENLRKKRQRSLCKQRFSRVKL